MTFSFINKTLFTTLAILLISSIAFAQDKKVDDKLSNQSRTIINLLDYISQDYSKAVKNGKIVSTSEYNEMLDFTQQSVSLFDSVSISVSIPDHGQFKDQFSELLNSIQKKQSKEIISAGAQKIKKQFLLLDLVDISPEGYPNIGKGKVLFLTHCQPCHGEYGKADGPLSASFTPPPANFQNNTLMKQISPLQVFNTARLGIKGTGMRAFDELSDKEVWDIAFYVKSLRFQNKLNKDSVEAIFSRIQPSPSLADIAHFSDKEFQRKLGKDSNLLASVRLHQASFNKDSTLYLALNNLNAALKLYKSGNVSAAENKALYAYLDGIEPVEQQLTAIDATIVPELENKMNAVRSAIKSQKPIKEVAQKISDAEISIHKAMVLLGNQTYSFWFTFLISSSILLREGIEAVLIIITIISLLKSLDAKKALKWIHGGWILAIGIGFASWFFTDWLISFGAQNRELMEAFGALLAVVVLLYVAFWLHNKTDAQKWKEFIEHRILKMLDQEKLFGLAFISFIVVFREAFESVIFLSSLQFQVDDDSRPGIWMGALVAIFVIFLVSNLILRFSVKVPVKKLFQYSAIIIMIFGVVLAGQGAHAFQESGWLTVNSIGFNFHSSTLGIYPTVETYTAQFIVLIVIMVLWFYQKSILKKIG
nr:FTR1 family protein [uncultured Pedobacter sp.]